MKAVTPILHAESSKHLCRFVQQRKMQRVCANAKMVIDTDAKYHVDLTCRRLSVLHCTRLWSAEFHRFGAGNVMCGCYFEYGEC